MKSREVNQPEAEDNTPEQTEDDLERQTERMLRYVSDKTPPDDIVKEELYVMNEFYDTYTKAEATKRANRLINSGMYREGDLKSVMKLMRFAHADYYEDNDINEFGLLVYKGTGMCDVGEDCLQRSNRKLRMRDLLNPCKCRPVPLKPSIV